MGNDVEMHGDSGTKKPKTKGFKKALNRLRDSDRKLSNRACVEWPFESERVCGAHDPAGAIVPVSELTGVIALSRTGQSLLKGPHAKRLSIVYDPQTPLSQFYSIPNGPVVIAINPYRPRGDLLTTLVRELRRAWQHHKGALANPMSFEPDEAVLVNRAQQADCFIFAIKVAWELKLIGEDEAWNALAGSPMADVTIAFEVHAQKDFRSLKNGHAARAAYDRFFDGSRTKSFDKWIIHQMLLDDRGYMKSTEKKRKADMDLFRRLGEIPDGKNYLSGEHKSPLDMQYTTVEDRSNANFLWFIKFERSFQERELEMMKESVKRSAEIVDFAKWAMNRRGGALRPA